MDGVVTAAPVSAVELNPITDFVAGTVAGAAALVTGFPFDVVKVRMQSPDFVGKYRSTFQAIPRIVQEERVLGLFTGITSPLVTCALMNGLVFASYKFFTKLQHIDLNADGIPELTLNQVFMAGVGSGIVSSVVTTPTELIKIQQQNRVMLNSKGVAPATQVVQQIYSTRGISGFFRGLGVTALRDAGYGVYFLTYEAVNRAFPVAPPEVVNAWGFYRNSVPSLLLAGGLAGVFSWCSTFPLDVVKTRIQSRPFTILKDTVATAETTSLLRSETPTHAYRSIWSTIVYSYHTEGIRVFFKGLGPTVLRAFPVNAVTFGVYELVLKFAA